jgi:hypothetical protein
MRLIFAILLLSIMSLDAYSQVFVGKLIEGLDSADLIMNDSVIGRIYKDERFITYKSDYDETYWSVWTKQDVFGALDKKYFTLLPNEKLFRIKTDTNRLFRTACGVHDMDNFRQFNIDYCTLVKKAVRGDETSLLKVLTMYKILYAAPVETHPYVTGRIINAISDSRLNKFLIKQSKSNQILIAEYLVDPEVIYPFADAKYYYSTFYPETWKTLKNLIELKN